MQAFATIADRSWYYRIGIYTLQSQTCIYPILPISDYYPCMALKRHSINSQQTQTTITILGPTGACSGWACTSTIRPCHELVA
jgi:hypothetical protein